MERRPHYSTQQLNWILKMDLTTWLIVIAGSLLAAYAALWLVLRYLFPSDT